MEEMAETASRTFSAEALLKEFNKYWRQEANEKWNPQDWQYERFLSCMVVIQEHMHDIIKLPHGTEVPFQLVEDLKRDSLFLGDNLDKVLEAMIEAYSAVVMTYTQGNLLPLAIMYKILVDQGKSYVDIVYAFKQLLQPGSPLYYAMNARIKKLQWQVCSTLAKMSPSTLSQNAWFGHDHFRDFFWGKAPVLWMECSNKESANKQDKDKEFQNACERYNAYALYLLSHPTREYALACVLTQLIVQVNFASISLDEPRNDVLASLQFGLISATSPDIYVPAVMAATAQYHNKCNIESEHCEERCKEAAERVEHGATLPRNHLRMMYQLLNRAMGRSGSLAANGIGEQDQGSAYTGRTVGAALMSAAALGTAAYVASTALRRKPSPPPTRSLLRSLALPRNAKRKTRLL